MNRLSLQDRARIVGCLIEGNSLRSTTRMVGCSINTVTKLLVDLGTACGLYHGVNKVRRIEPSPDQTTPTAPLGCAARSGRNRRARYSPAQRIGFWW